MRAEASQLKTYIAYRMETLKIGKIFTQEIQIKSRKQIPVDLIKISKIKKKLTH